MLKLNDFKKGMRVKSIEEGTNGLVGTVDHVNQVTGLVGVEFDTKLGRDWFMPNGLRIISNLAAKQETCSLPTAEEDNVEEVCAENTTRARLLKAHATYQLATQMKKEALEEIELILREMESN